MGLRWMTTRRMMVAVAAVALALGGIIGMNELDRRADHCRKEAEYHRRMEQESEAKAVYWEALASDPAREVDLALALFRAGRWSRDQAHEIQLESLHSPSRPRWKRVSSEAKEIARNQARTYRRVSEYHARERRRYERDAFGPWLTLERDKPSPEP
jgi:hypothetical protein